MTWKEVLESDATEVIVGSYGYLEGRVNPTWQPFKNKRELKFHVIRFKDGDGYLEYPNNTFFLREDERDLTFELRSDGSIYVDDPELGSDIDY